VVKFRSLNITNDGVFYTDSNGLEMQRRDINTHEKGIGFTKENITSFDDIDRIITIPEEDNVAKNYYPVTSAIAIRDNFTQMTIMNDRTQGGTSLSNGTIELMQNRRILADDQKGMSEPLDEYDDYHNTNDINMIGLRYSAQEEYPGTGIITNVKYYVEVFSLNKTKS